MINDVLIVIPARGGSKGIPGKNIKPLVGKPLIEYSIDVARQLVPDEHICVTTDSDEIIRVVEEYGLHVPFKRPAELATDHCGSNEVLQHALRFYIEHGFTPRVVLLLQPTSPFRKKEFLEEALSLYDETIDMVVSVKEAASNPYYNCFEEDQNGYLLLRFGEPMNVNRLILFFIRVLMYFGSGIYLREYCRLTGVRKDSVEEWMLPVAAARLSEWMTESERKKVIKFVRKQINNL